MDIQSIDRIDHHGIVAGTIQDIGLIKLIDDHLGTFDDEKLSAGEVIAGMIINGLGFSDRPLSLVPQFFKTCPLKALFGRDVDPDDFNRFKLGRVLDRAHSFGCEQLFTLLASRVIKDEGIDHRFGHLDSSSFSLTGEYMSDIDKQAITVTHGHSKDHRPDLKQVVLEMMVTQDGAVPLVAKSWDGNASDNTIFSERCKSLTTGLKDSVWPEFIVADSKLYSKANADNLASLAFITRVPNTIKDVGKKIELSIDDENKWVEFSPERKYQTFETQYMDIGQRWIVVHSQPALDRTRKTIERRVAKESDRIEKELMHLSAKRFSCEPDAIDALQEKVKKWKLHQLTESKINQLAKFGKRGRPTTNEAPSHYEFQVSASFSKDEQVIDRQIDRGACYVLGTNIPATKLSDAEVIANYSEQNSVEMGFRFLKDPIFFVSSLFVKKPSRIMGLLMVMCLALLVFSIAERRLRLKLKEMDETLPNQINRPTKTPTLRWVFQMMYGLHMVTINTDGELKTFIKGMNDLHRKIVGFFSERTMAIYQAQLI